MLINLREYHRPTRQAGGDRKREALEQALALLARPDVRTVPLAGGDTLIGSAEPAVQAVVDLQGLGLDGITGASSLEIGAMATRAALAGDEASQKLFDGLLAEGARRWGGNVQRNRATVGGAVAVAAPTDPLLAAFLVCDATVVLYTGDGYRELLLADFLPRRAHVLATPVFDRRFAPGSARRPYRCGDGHGQPYAGGCPDRAGGGGHWHGGRSLCDSTPCGRRGKRKRAAPGQGRSCPVWQGTHRRRHRRCRSAGERSRRAGRGLPRQRRVPASNGRRFGPPGADEARAHVA